MIPGEVALHHQLLVCDMMIEMPPQIKRKFTPRPKVWKLRDPQTCSRFQEVFKAHVPAVETEAATTSEEIWEKLKTGLLKTTEEVCGTTKPHRWQRETWWWNKEVDDAITAKRQAFKVWKAGKCTRASYNTAKRISRHVVHHASHEADKVVYEGIEHISSDIFNLANQMRKENVDVVGDKPVKNDAGEMSMSEEVKQNAWAEHSESILNVEFDWDPDHLSKGLQLEGPPIPITIDLVKKAISDEVGQSCRSIRYSGGDDQGSRWYRCHHDPRLSVMARYQLTGSKVLLSAFTKTRVMLCTEATIEASS